MTAAEPIWLPRLKCSTCGGLMKPSEVASCLADDCAMKPRLPPDPEREAFLPVKLDRRKKRRGHRRRNPERSLIKYRAECFDRLLRDLLNLSQTTHDDSGYPNPLRARVRLELAVEIAAKIVCGGK